MISPFRSLFIHLTPFHLSILAIVLIINTDYKKSSFQIYLGICLIMGWLIEAAGVHSGMIFGRYFYGESLGLKILEVPVIIGLNWFILSYTLLCVTKNIFHDHFSRATAVAILMTLFDLVMEPAAIHAGFWSWYCQGIPTQNYLAWFLFSWMFAFTGLKLDINFENRTAVIILLCLTLFFLVLDIALFI